MKTSLFLLRVLSAFFCSGFSQPFSAQGSLSLFLLRVLRPRKQLGTELMVSARSLAGGRGGGVPRKLLAGGARFALVVAHTGAALQQLVA
jgi:hypothetical protein